ncbi:amino acid adenylation domain-containing protein [Lentzea waywayandensis]|uniref:Amino acid adenylation domain-containing protein n=1 Tax=Lentzea waywayandensis TaxID=84724 RepID=A0A1I6FFL3_9PSEU|nr:AMP-binding protein [Lentzea waywayandensis]SFR28736.1 amino acid adenylation domain-containing protein [Lentzea waywayandensis]
MGLATIVARHLSAGGDRPALESGGRTWSYADLDRVTADRAAQLRAAAPEGRVVLAGEHTAEALIWALAVMRAGLIYTPVNANQPGERLREALELAEPALVLCCTDAIAAVLRKEDVAVLTPGELPAGQPGDWPVHEIAYSVFTSGSSGLPKLVNVGHRGIENLCQAQTRAFGIEQGTRVLQFSSLSFDASIAEILVTLYAGGTLVVPAWDGGSWVNAVGTHLSEQGCDVITLPPSVYARLDDDARQGIRTVVFAGEALSEVEYRAAERHSRVLNAYGPTEGTVCFSVAEMTRFTTTVGKPIDGYTPRAFDGTGYHASGRGELVLVGPGVALGYEGREDAVFTLVDGEPAYHTGDEAEVRDGEVFYLGRIDDQIKRLGHRISLTDLEGRLSRLLDSRVAMVLDGASLVLAHTCADFTEAELRTRLREVLPAWEVPDVLVRLDSLPVTESGKADREAVRELARATPAAPDATGPDPEFVRGIVTRLLGEEIDPATSVFDAGASSFTLVQIQVELAARYGEDEVQEAFDQLNYDFTIEGFLAALGGAEPQASPAHEVFAKTSADLAGLNLAPIPSTATEGAITVTGAGGFIGGHVLDRLLGAGREITVVTRSRPERLVERHLARFGRAREDFSGVRFLGYDELSAQDGWGAVVHCGFEVNHVLPLERHLANSVATTRALVRAAQSARRFVFLSAASVGAEFVRFTAEALAAVGDPYSQAKFVAEAYVEQLACPSDLLRVGLVYGHTAADEAFLDEDVFSWLLRLSKRHGVLPRLSGLVPVCDVRDVVTAALTAADATTTEGEKTVLVHRTYDLAALREELGVDDVVEPAQWLTTVTEGGADSRILAALRLWLTEDGWAHPVPAPGRQIISELRQRIGE